MTTRIWETQITVPAGTAIASPVTQSWVTEDAYILSVELIVPPGHNGLTGIRVSKGDVQILPWSASSWIIANDYTRVFPVEDYIPTLDMKIQAYNTGQYPHTFYLRQYVTDYVQPGQVPGAAVPQPLPIEGLTVSTDPLSPSAILGSDVANALTTGDLTANDVAPLQPTPVDIPPEPQPTGL